MKNTNPLIHDEIRGAERAVIKGNERKNVSLYCKREKVIGKVIIRDSGSERTCFIIFLNSILSG